MIGDVLSIISIFAIGGFTFSVWQYKSESKIPVFTSWCVVSTIALIKLGMAIQRLNQ